jgi:hypothetical protein
VARLLCILWILLPLGAWSQLADNRRLVNFDTSKDTVQLDTLSINPESFVLVRRNGKPFPASAYKVDYDKAQVLFIRSKFKEEKLFTITPLVASFRVFPINFSKPLFHKDPNTLKRNRDGEFNKFSKDGSALPIRIYKCIASIKTILNIRLKICSGNIICGKFIAYPDFRFFRKSP